MYIKILFRLEGSVSGQRTIKNRHMDMEMVR